MKRLWVLCSLLLAAVLVTAIAPGGAFAQPHGARAPLPLAAAAARIPASVGGELPGNPMPPSPVSGTLEGVNAYDVYYVDLTPGQRLDVSMTGPTGSWFLGVLVLNTGSSQVRIVDLTLGPLPDMIGFPQELSYVAGTAGRYTLMVGDVDGAGPYSFTWSVQDPPIAMDRVAGSSRWATAIAVSRKAYAAGASPNVIVASGASFPDALAASPLAGSYDCPILLTPTSSLAPGLLDEIDRLRGASSAKVFIVGGYPAVSLGVERALVAHGGLTVQRLSGANRYETAAAVAAEVKRHETVDLHNAWSGEAFITKGGDFPDALAASPIAASRKMPILLVDPKSVPPATAAAVSGLGITHAYVLGGSLAVNGAVATRLGVPWDRIEGPTGSGRYGTACRIADVAVSKGWASAGTIGLATGKNFPDALGGGPFIGKKGGVLLLVNPADYAIQTWSQYPPLWADWVFQQRTQVKSMYAFGSHLALNDYAFDQFLQALQP